MDDARKRGGRADRRAQDGGKVNGKYSRVDFSITRYLTQPDHGFLHWKWPGDQ
jgi:hypothetical protein